MNKIYHYCAVALTSLALVSCGDDFLDKTPKNTVDPEVDVTDSVAVAMANGCYRTLQSSNMYNQRLWTLDIVAGNSIVGAGVVQTVWRLCKPQTSLPRVTTAWLCICGAPHG